MVKTEVKMIVDNDIILKCIANHLIINEASLSNLGLSHGKIGIILYFFHYAHYSRNPIYARFAGELLDDLYEDLDDKCTFCFEDGLSGIGWGVLYLLENGFIEGNSDEILCDIDNKIMEWDLNRICNSKDLTEFIGISQYINYRIKYSENSFDKNYLSNWRKLLVLLEEIDTISLKKLIVNNPFVLAENVSNWNLGLVNGCAGFGLKMINI